MAPFISAEKPSNRFLRRIANRKVNRREPATWRGVQARERTPAPHIPASAAPAEARQPASAGVAKIFLFGSRKNFGEVCHVRRKKECGRANRHAEQLSD